MKHSTILPKLSCPYCQSEHSKIVDSRPSLWTDAIQRRRQCQRCAQRFTTQERIVGTYLKKTTRTSTAVRSSGVG